MRDEKKIEVSRLSFAILIAFCIASWGMVFSCFISDDTEISSESIVLIFAGIVAILVVASYFLSEKKIQRERKSQKEVFEAEKKKNESDIYKSLGRVFEMKYMGSDEEKEKVSFAIQALYYYSMALIPENEASENEAIRSSITNTITQTRKLLKTSVSGISDVHSYEALLQVSRQGFDVDDLITKFLGK